MGGAKHGGIGARLIIRLGGHVEAHGLGGVYGPDTSFRIGENERIPPEGEPDGMWPFAPDLAVEIVSLTDLYEGIYRKVMEYFAAGVRQVWLISPQRRTVAVHHSPTQVRILSDDDELTGDDLAPGFRCRVGDLFHPPTRT